jgi:serine/threonine-protein kinase
VIRLVTKHLSFYDIRHVRERLVKYVRGGRVPEIKRLASRSRKAILATLVLFLISLGGLAYVGYIHGYHYEFLWPEDYGSLKIVAKIRRGIKSPRETFLTGVLFYDDGAKIPRVENVSLTFREDTANRSDQHFVLATPRIFLKSGHYRAKVQLEDNLYWKTFYLAPREIQKRSLATSDAQIVSVDMGEAPPRRLDVQYRVIDQSNGQDITEGTTASLLRGSRWIELNESVAQTLTTGNRYQFRFGKAGFYSKDYDLIIAAEQTKLDLNVSLMPQPGRVLIRSNHDGLRLLLGNFSSYISGEESRRRIDLQPSSSKTQQELILSPGDHRLSAVYSSSIKEQIKFHLESGDTIEVFVQFNPDTESLWFEILEETR